MSDSLLHKDIQALIARLKHQDLSLSMLEKRSLALFMMKSIWSI